MRRIAAPLCLALLLATRAAAIVIHGGTGTENFSNPGGGLPWAYVGSVGGASGVYLGNYGGNHWVLTASHVVGSGASLSNLVLDGTPYSFVPGSGVVVRNGDTSTTDLTLFRISGDPGLANLQLAISTPVNGSTVTMVGRGNEEGSINYWAVTVNPGASDDVWNNQGGTMAGSNRSGYLWAANGDMRWGTNNVEGTTTYNVGTGLTTAFFTDFDSGGSDAQGATGDSGGATFYYNGVAWELAGIMGAIGGFENQPASTAVIGNITYSANIATYYSFITSAIPEPSTYAAACGALALGFATFRRRQKAG
jgi:hypothetical protein